MLLNLRAQQPVGLLDAGECVGVAVLRRVILGIVVLVIIIILGIVLVLVGLALSLGPFLLVLVLRRDVVVGIGLALLAILFAFLVAAVVAAVDDADVEELVDGHILETLLSRGGRGALTLDALFIGLLALLVILHRRRQPHLLRAATLRGNLRMLASDDLPREVLALELLLALLLGIHVVYPPPTLRAPVRRRSERPARCGKALHRRRR